MAKHKTTQAQENVSLWMRKLSQAEVLAMSSYIKFIHQFADNLQKQQQTFW